MTVSAMSRLPGISALVIGVLLILPGCGGKPAAGTATDSKEQGIPSSTGAGSTGHSGAETPAAGSAMQPATVDIKSGVGKEAVDFLQAVRAGTAKADQLSAPFAKAIGLPIVFDSDKAKGYSASSAEDWMRKVGASIQFGLPLSSTLVGDVALFRGMLQGKTGGYWLRMVKEGGSWKVDWLSASTAHVKKGIAASSGSADAVLQEFAVTAVVEAICDKDAMPSKERTAVVAAGMTPRLRAEWAPPLDGDRTTGHDYSPAKLAFKINDIGNEVESVNYTQNGDAEYSVEIVKSGGAKVMYHAKLTRDATLGRWLVEHLAGG